jgi:hypothetical protein
VADPMSEAVAGRARLAILTSQKDHTRKRDVVNGAANLAQLGVSVGAVALVMTVSSGRNATTRLKSIQPSPRQAPEPSARHLGR